MGNDIPKTFVEKRFAAGKINRRGKDDVVLLLPVREHFPYPVDFLLHFTVGHLSRFFAVLITMAAAEVAAFGEMPLDEKIKGSGCRTGNYLLFHFLQL